VPTATEDLTGIERLVRQDRLVVALALGLITALSWVYLVRMAQAMQSAASAAEMHAAMGMADMTRWTLSDNIALFLMWAVMMAGMMLPSAAPFLLLVVATYRRRGGRQARKSTAAFTAGYLAAWTGFSAVAALAQGALHAAALMSSAMVSQSATLAGGIFVVAGIYQWAPWKNACLSNCRSPLSFLTTEWREGTAGAFVMGLRHGLFCVGCCWALMLLLFAAGVMNLLWVAAIAVFVLGEKLLPRALLIGRVTGALLVCWGAYLLIRGA
jgi:predicted metal-binding membrane protein